VAEPTRNKPRDQQGTEQKPRRNNPNAERLRAHRKLTYGDQKGQVDFLVNNVLNYERNGLKRDGFFVDLACADGVTINNSYFLERWLNWTGLLFEPNPGFWPSVRKNRNSKLIPKCVSDRAGQTVRFRTDNGMLGGIVSDDTDNNSAVRGDEFAQASIVDLETTTLMAELVAEGAPDLIDFLSLDIEGAEYLALRNFDFSRFRFRCAAIERPTPELDILLDSNGYRQAFHTAFDVIYVHQSFWDEINFTPNAFFSFTPRKAF
jgi:FkbM family methyltransferase